jgi:hypothetical protein
MVFAAGCIVPMLTGIYATGILNGSPRTLPTQRPHQLPHRAHPVSRPLTQKRHLHTLEILLPPVTGNNSVEFA